jgi:hypothetical protein
MMVPIPGASEILAIARERTGLQGDGDERFLEALDQLVRSINAEATPTLDGRHAALERFVRLAVNRLRFHADLASHPEILEEVLTPPLIICGLPRVGSTKLHRLVAQSGDFQALLFWQGFNPAPFPGASADRRDPRIAEAVRFLEWRSRLNPATDAAHFIAATEPEEDTYLLEFTLHTYWPTSYFEVPAFLHWLSHQDRDHAYRYVRQLLQYLQWQFHRERPRSWVLKNPLNLGFERELARHLPGAKFVVLHRDPVEVIPSTVAIVREVRRLYCGAAGDLRSTGAWALAEYSGAMTRHMEWRRSLPGDAVLDLAYTDVRDDHAGVLARVYDFCGLDLSKAAVERMQTWAGDNEQHKHGLHRYSLEESGLSPETIRRRFATYLDAFGSYLEPVKA